MDFNFCFMSMNKIINRADRNQTQFQKIKWFKNWKVKKVLSIKDLKQKSFA